MKKFLLVLILSVFCSSTFAQETLTTYSKGSKFGLKNSNGSIVTDANFNKLIRIGNSSWLVQKGSLFGLIDNSGNYIIQPKYTRAERIIGRFVKLGNGSNYGLFDANGNSIIPMEYSSIDLLFGKMFLVGKHHKYGLISFEGKTLLEPVADDIYMPKPSLMRISYNGKWYEIEQVRGEEIKLPDDIKKVSEDSENFRVEEIITNPVASTSYGIVSASDYALKTISSISPAYENTIDELILNHGADVGNILMNFSWLAKFPFVYAKNYANTWITPNNGPFSNIKASLKNQIKE